MTVRGHHWRAYNHEADVQPLPDGSTLVHNGVHEQGEVVMGEQPLGAGNGLQTFKHHRHHPLGEGGGKGRYGNMMWVTVTSPQTKACAASVTLPQHSRTPSAIPQTRANSMTINRGSGTCLLEQLRLRLEPNAREHQGILVL